MLVLPPYIYIIGLHRSLKVSVRDVICYINRGTALRLKIYWCLKKINAVFFGRVSYENISAFVYNSNTIYF